jgi:hypothetical protein
MLRLGNEDRFALLTAPLSTTIDVERLQAVVELVPHALNLLDGKTEHA